MYGPARERVFTARNIRSGWSGAGLFPFNLSKLLKEIQKPDLQLSSSGSDEIDVESLCSRRGTANACDASNSRIFCIAFQSDGTNP